MTNPKHRRRQSSRVLKVVATRIQSQQEQDARQKCRGGCRTVVLAGGDGLGPLPIVERVRLVALHPGDKVRNVLRCEVRLWASSERQQQPRPQPAQRLSCTTGRPGWKGGGWTHVLPGRLVPPAPPRICAQQHPSGHELGGPRRWPGRASVDVGVGCEDREAGAALRRALQADPRVHPYPHNHSCRHHRGNAALRSCGSRAPTRCSVLAVNPTLVQAVRLKEAASPMTCGKTVVPGPMMPCSASPQY